MALSHGGEKKEAVGLDSVCEELNEVRLVFDVFDHFHTGHDVEGSVGQVFDQPGFEFEVQTFSDVFRCDSHACFVWIEPGHVETESGKAC